ncbi:hypothetical protein DHEL01_v209113 [Diaporthe helianthi]|uniref:Acyltransferase 3 domain-containing protein n=1 Tax=Diaporthe helianthi TaxID=158607 RepID=A0A2P5HQK1_DIAHE|nr:hypothetical protein DHEL01_v209113 [Diaporthe helianthi]
MRGTVLSNNKGYALERRHDLDLLRLWLTVLVICTWHVLDLTATGGVINKIGGLSFMRPSILLAITREVPRAFVIPACFWISGRLTARSVEGAGKSPGKLVVDRTIRLFVPSVAFTLLIWPFALLPGAGVSDFPSLWRFLLDYWKSLNGIQGPAWYSATLLCFDYGLALLKKVSETTAYRRLVSRPGASLLVSLRAYMALSTYGWAGLTMTSYLIRQAFPNRVIFVPLSVRPGFLLGYIYAYGMGYQSFCHSMSTMTGPFSQAKLGYKSGLSMADNLESDGSERNSQDGPRTQITVLKSRASARLAIAILVSLAFYLSILIVPALIEIFRPHMSGGHFSAESNWTSISEALVLRIDHLYFDAGFDIDTALYAIWREFTVFGLIGPAITEWFYEFYSGPMQEPQERVGWCSRTFFTVFSPRYSFVAYLDHGPIGILLCWLVESTFVKNSAHPWLHFIYESAFAREITQIGMTLVDFALVTVVSFAVGWLVVEKVPGCKKVL